MYRPESRKGLLRSSAKFKLWKEATFKDSNTYNESILFTPITCIDSFVFTKLLFGCPHSIHTRTVLIKFKYVCLFLA